MLVELKILLSEIKSAALIRVELLPKTFRENGPHPFPKIVDVIREQMTFTSLVQR